MQQFDHFINGKNTPPENGEYLAVINPCNGQQIASIARGNGADVDKALKSSEDAFKPWSKKTMAERVALQHKAADAMRSNIEDLAQTISSELGRPLEGCYREIERSADLLDYYAEEALRLKGEIPMMNVEGEKVLIIRQPIGVVVSITPFNYPITLLVLKIGAALAVGCTVTSKPAEDTPLSTLKLARLFHEAGYPNGVFNVITGKGREIGDELVAHKIPRKITFTGGTSVGQRIAKIAADTNKRVTLELGGQSPAIVCEDADITEAAKAIAKHAFANSGQFCYRVNRVYAHQKIYDEFMSLLCAEVEQFKVGDVADRSCTHGPLVNEKIFNTSDEQSKDARLKGADFKVGGHRLTGDIYDKGYYFAPTVIGNTNHEMQIMTEETFGPVLGVMKFESIDDAINLANDSIFGLAAYVFSKDIGKCIQLSEALEAGSVWVNKIQRSYHLAPFGGVKQSGMGREKSVHGLEEYTELKTIYLNY